MTSGRSASIENAVTGDAVRDATEKLEPDTGLDFDAWANHRKAIGAEITTGSEMFRRMRLDGERRRTDTPSPAPQAS